MRLYPEQEKGANYERGVCFGTEQNGIPGEEHVWTRALQARSPTQVRAHFDQSYDPSRVDGLGEYGLSVPTVQKTLMQTRDVAPRTSSTLPKLAQRFEQDFVRPEGRDTGLRVLSEGGARAEVQRAAHGRLRVDLRPTDETPAEVTALGELEPRMGVWGHEARDREASWFSPPGPRQLPWKDRIVATQKLRGLGDIMGPGLGDIAASYQVWPDQATALKKGYGHLFYQGGAIGITTPHGPITIVDASTVYPTMQEALRRGYGFMYQQGSQVVVSGPAGPTPINSPPTGQAPPAPTPVSQLQPAPSKPGGVFLPPPPAAGTAPLPSGGQGTNTQAPQVAPPGTPLVTPQGPVVTTQGGGLAPVQVGAPTTTSSTPYQPGTIVPGPNGMSVVAQDGVTLIPIGAPGSVSGGGYSGGGGSSGGSYSGGDALTTTPPSAPAGPLAFLTAPINIPVVGAVPTWAPLLLASLLIMRRRRESSGPRTNPKKKGGKKR